jgi:hypothetical protein
MFQKIWLHFLTQELKLSRILACLVILPLREKDGIVSKVSRDNIANLLHVFQNSDGCDALNI